MRITHHRLLRRATRRLYLWFGIFCLLAFQAHAQAPLSLAEALKLSRTQPLLQSQRAAMTAARPAKVHSPVDVRETAFRSS